MKLLLIPALAGAVFLLAGCVTPSGGLPVVGEMDFNAEGFVGHNLNVFGGVIEGEMTAQLVEYTTGIPVYPALSLDGSFAFLRVHRPVDGGEPFDIIEQRPPPPEILYLPPEYALYAYGIRSPATWAQYFVKFEAPE